MQEDFDSEGGVATRNNGKQRAGGDSKRGGISAASAAPRQILSLNRSKSTPTDSIDFDAVASLTTREAVLQQASTAQRSSSATGPVRYWTSTDVGTQASAFTNWSRAGPTSEHAGGAAVATSTSPSLAASSPLSTALKPESARMSPSLGGISPLEPPHRSEIARYRNEMSKFEIAGHVPSTLLGATYHEIRSPSLGTQFEAAAEGLQLAFINLKNNMGMFDPESFQANLHILRSEAQRLSSEAAMAHKQLEEANRKVESMRKCETRMQAKFLAMQSDLELLRKLSHPISFKKASKDAMGLWEHGREKGIAMYNGSKRGERYLESTKGVDEERTKLLLKKCIALQQQVEELQQLQQLTTCQEEELEILRQLLEDREVQMKVKEAEKGRELAAERERRQALEREWHEEREIREKEKCERDGERERDMERERAEWADREKTMKQMLHATQQLLDAQKLDQGRESRKTKNQVQGITETVEILAQDVEIDDEDAGIHAEAHKSSLLPLKIPAIPIPPLKGTASAHRRPSPRTYQVVGAPASGQGAEMAALQKTLEMKEMVRMFLCAFLLSICTLVLILMGLENRS